MSLYTVNASSLFRLSLLVMHQKSTFCITQLSLFVVSEFSQILCCVRSSTPLSTPWAFKAQPPPKWRASATWLTKKPWHQGKEVGESPARTATLLLHLKPSSMTWKRRRTFTWPHMKCQGFLEPSRPQVIPENCLFDLQT